MELSIYIYTVFARSRFNYPVLFAYPIIERYQQKKETHKTTGSMASLNGAIQNIPIIDHHAHNLLLPHELSAHPSLSITTEAHDGALPHTKSSLSHLRAVKQLSDILNCEANWDTVEVCLDEERSKPDDEWAKRCFEGIETALIDDGLDDEIVHPFAWHDSKSICPHVEMGAGKFNPTFWNNTCPKQEL